MIGRTLPELTIAVLAAGYSTRLGQPKALATLRGSTLLGRTLAALRPFAATARILVIAPPRFAPYRRAAGAHVAEIVVNAQRVGGLSTSVRCAIAHAQYSAALLLLPVDLARLQARDLRRLIECWQGRRRAVVARRVDGAAATPLILPHALFAGALRIGGDRGLRDWVSRLPRSRIVLLSLPSADFDVDTPGDLAWARGRRDRVAAAVASSSPENRETQ